MDKVNIQLPIYEYVFTFSAIESINFTVYSGKTWHSVLGKSLRQLLCIYYPEDKVCKNCTEYLSCDYSLIFEGRRQTGCEKAPTNIIVPHIIRVQNQQAEKVLKGEYFQVTIILLGNVNNYFKILLQAMKIAGINGIESNRSKAKLVSIELQLPNGLTQMIVSQQQGYQEANSFSKQLEYYPLLKAPEEVTLKLITPYRGKKDSIRDLLTSIWIRVGFSQDIYTGEKLVCDFKMIKQQIKTVPIIKSKLSWIKDRRWSTRKGKYVDTSGRVGEIILELKGHSDLWPFLYYGQWLNVGKNSSMGFGQYQLISVTRYN